MQGLGPTHTWPEQSGLTGNWLSCCGPVSRRGGGQACVPARTAAATLLTASAARRPCPHVQNRRNTPERLELMKYNPHLRKYTLHREIK